MLAAALCAFARASSASSFGDVKTPTGIPAEVWSYFIPKDNPLTAAKIELGRQLFFDQRLSADGSISCASCHEPQRGFADGRKTAVGIGGRRGPRNTPTLLNAMFSSTLFWDGRAVSLEGQAPEPLLNPDEMGNLSGDDVVARLAAIPEYRNEFQSVFAAPVDMAGISKAIAAYERTLVAANAPFDQFLAGNQAALSEAAQRGFNLFRTKGRCSVCHSLNNSFPLFTDGNYRNTGVAANYADYDSLLRRVAKLNRKSAADSQSLDQEKGKLELGRFMVTRDTLDIGTFRTPMLRNVELTAPYFHDGSAATLADVIRYYVKGGNQNAIRDWELQAVNLSDDEQRDLIEFLKSLTSDEFTSNK